MDRQMDMTHIAACLDVMSLTYGSYGQGKSGNVEVPWCKS